MKNSTKLPDNWNDICVCGHPRSDHPAGTICDAHIIIEHQTGNSTTPVWFEKKNLCTCGGFRKKLE